MGETSALLSPTYGARATRNRQDFPRQFFGGAYYGDVYSNGGKSILFSNAGNTELYEGTNATLGIANDYTVMAWVKPIPSTIAALNIISLGNTAQLTDNWELSCRSNSENFRMFMQGDSGGNTTRKDYRFGTMPTEPSAAIWTMVGATWDGTTLTVYQDGVAVVPTSASPDDACVQTDASRRCGLGVNGKSTAATSFDGHIHSVCMWNTTLDADNILAMYNGGDGNGFNLRENSGNYTGASNIAQLYLLGTQVSPNLGKYVEGFGSFHFADENNSSDDDIVDEAPTG